MRALQILLLFCIIACSTTIRPPEGGSTLVALVDHGRHATLLIQAEKEVMVRYAFGDWRFYAEARPGIFNGLRALFWPTQAALGRKELQGPFTRAYIIPQLRDGVSEMFIFRVKEEKARKLRARLDKIFYENKNTFRVNHEYGLDFVYFPSNYWAFNNSNQKMGSWLKELGAKVEGMAIFSDWAVEQ